MTQRSVSQLMMGVQVFTWWPQLIPSLACHTV